MLCPNCDTKIPDTSKFCLECGEKIELSDDSAKKTSFKWKMDLKAVAGPLKGKKFGAEEPMSIMIGRKDCSSILISGEEDSMISRQHCVVQLEFPEARLKDIGSKNGTYLNGMKIEKDKNYDIKSGDIIKAGKSVFAVDIFKVKVDGKSKRETKLMDAVSVPEK
ncbi:MAG TPA: hypothetical protein DCZ94_02440 [Lentisphaeria bacterium]|nr:MAG: hypothetical protein A2X48_16110 [Lentisphaerae bacterium GWF2_49_21]HBC85793.1 hypothetical protein [Lentisphaeria bacterium]